MTEQTIFSQSVTDFLKAFGNEKRQEIILAIFTDGQEHNISEVAGRVNIAQSTASEHLAMLKRAGALVSRKVEKEVLYCLNRPGILARIDEIKALLNCCVQE
jgi:DNA-binding transcriptional ArsR family regulator